MKKNDFTKQAEEFVAQMTTQEMMDQLLYDAPEIKRLGLKSYNYWGEALHGVARAGIATVFPQAIGMAAMFDEKFLQDIADIISTEARGKYNYSQEAGDYGIYKNLTLWSPNINIFRDPRWGRGHETYGEDPYLTSKLGVAFVKGLQGEGEYLKTAATAKHYAVHSGPEHLRHVFDAKTSRKDLYETYLPAFEACVKEAKVESVMGAYNRTNGEPCNGSKLLLEDILRKEWGFDGHVVSDFMAILDFHTGHHVTETAEESAALALKRGCDLNAGFVYKALGKALEQGLITEEDIRRAAVRVIRTRMRLGMFDENCEYNKISYEEVHKSEHIRMAELAAEKSMVLLKNDGILPLKKEQLNKIAVIGPNAYSIPALYGNYNGESDEWVTNLDGLRKEAGEDIRIFYSKGAHISLENDDMLGKPGRLHGEALAAAKVSDLVILCVGLDGTIEGESVDEGNPDAAGDKRDLLLPNSQRLLCDKLLELGKPVILVINSGSALDLSEYDGKVNAIVQSWYSGERGGEALARMIFGKYAPSGKLPLTFYYNDQDIPDIEDYSMQKRTYRYVTMKPWYPFGYGLSYNKYEYSKLTVKEQEGLVGTISVKNCGTMTGEEVIQGYLRYEGELQEKPSYTLCYFNRVSLLAGEEKTIEFHIPGKYLTTVTEDGNRVFVSGNYTLYLGGNAPDERSVELTGHIPCSSSFVMEENGGISQINNIETKPLTYPELMVKKERVKRSDFGLFTPINELLAYEETQKVLFELMPEVAGDPRVASIGMSLNDVIAYGKGAIPADVVVKLEERLSKIKK